MFCSAERMYSTVLVFFSFQIHSTLYQISFSCILFFAESFCCLHFVIKNVLLSSFFTHAFWSCYNAPSTRSAGLLWLILTHVFSSSDCFLTIVSRSILFAHTFLVGFLQVQDLLIGSGSKNLHQSVLICSKTLRWVHRETATSSVPAATFKLPLGKQEMNVWKWEWVLVWQK